MGLVVSNIINQTDKAINTWNNLRKVYFVMTNHSKDQDKKLEDHKLITIAFCSLASCLLLATQNIPEIFLVFMVLSVWR